MTAKYTGCMNLGDCLNIDEVAQSDLGFYTLTMKSDGALHTKSNKVLYSAAGAASCILGDSGFEFWTAPNGKGTRIGVPQPAGVTNLKGVVVEDDGILIFYNQFGQKVSTISNMIFPDHILLEELEAFARAFLRHLEAKEYGVLRTLESKLDSLRREFLKLFDPSAASR